MRQPKYRTKSGTDVYDHVNDGCGREVYGIRRREESLHGHVDHVCYKNRVVYEYVPGPALDPFEPIARVYLDRTYPSVVRGGR